MRADENISESKMIKHILRKSMNTIHIPAHYFVLRVVSDFFPLELRIYVSRGNRTYCSRSARAGGGARSSEPFSCVIVGSTWRSKASPPPLCYRGLTLLLPMPPFLGVGVSVAVLRARQAHNSSVHVKRFLKLRWSETQPQKRCSAVSKQKFS